jgi:hypothetical protein
MVAVQSPMSATGREENRDSSTVVSPDMAAEWLERYKYAHNRPLSLGTVVRYADMMQSGKFLNNSELVFVRYHGARFLINGQHRLAAQVRASATVSYILIEHEAYSEYDINLRYGLQDTGRPRRFRDMYHSLGVCDELGMTANQIDAVASAMNFMKSDLHGKNSAMPRQDLIALVRLYAPFARHYCNLIVGSPKIMGRAMMRQSTLSVALLSLRYIADAAVRISAPSIDEFWRGVAIDDRISVTDPRKYASRHLMESTVRKTAATVERRFARPSYSSRYLIQCFNAYMERRDLKGAPKVLDDSAPISMWNLSTPPEHWTRIP